MNNNLLKFIIVTISNSLFDRFFIGRTTFFRTFQNSIFERLHTDLVGPEVLAEPVLLSVDPEALQPFAVLPEISSKSVFPVAGVRSDEDVPRLGREVAAVALELVRLEGALVVAAIVKDLKQK